MATIENLACLSNKETLTTNPEDITETHFS